MRGERPSLRLAKPSEQFESSHLTGVSGAMVSAGKQLFGQRRWVGRGDGGVRERRRSLGEGRPTSCSDAPDPRLAGPFADSGRCLAGVSESAGEPTSWVRSSATGSEGGCRPTPASARELAARGVTVAGLALAEAVRELPQDRAMLVTSDVSDAGQVEQAVARTVKEFGRLDVVCDVAGIVDDATPTHEVQLERWHRVFAVDLTGSFLITAVPCRTCWRTVAS
ncbi:SDR family NAD(P)-dependent oxidoreductase [Streptomyces spiralis]|uniref:SDR family NAD(P)-dependent oxidoreductase n=1 Tax=Streptomyces spiralis TaxID=66376 RepID=UPI0034069573